MSAPPQLTLVVPPLGDPTVPYHATAYLAGSLEAAGFHAVAQRDANAEFVNWCVAEATYNLLTEEARRRSGRLGAKRQLAFDEQDAFYELWCRREIAYEDVAHAIATQRNFEAFLDYPTYIQSVEVIRSYFGLVGALSNPGAIEDFVLVTNGHFSFTSFADLLNDELSRKVCWPFYRFLEETWAEDPVIANTTCLGISITYQHQLFHALALARWFRERWPGRKVLLGGTEISRIYRSVRRRADLVGLFSLCDGFVVGEAETAICEIAGDGFQLKPGAKVRNLVSYDPVRDEILSPNRVAYEDVAGIAVPRYDIAWKLYMSPVRAINYSPTRGCYWNRCAFCSYGLSEDGPTSPWRVRPADLAARELAKLGREHDIGYVYFAVDAISPAYLEDLAEELLRQGTGFKWSAELRLETVFRRALCDKLARSGCVSALFGLESGSQRVLDAMDKGTRVQTMSESMRHFADAGVAVQVMTFAGFPTETPSDREETFQFLERCSDHWSNGGMGRFVLLDGSAVAKEPERFGVRLKPTLDGDIEAIRAFELVRDGIVAEVPPSDQEAETARARAADVFPRSFPRPWAGGADTLHSMIYYHRHGRRFFREHPLPETRQTAAPASDRELARCSIRLQARVSESPFDLGLLLAQREQWRQNLARSERSGQTATHAWYAATVAQQPHLPRGDATHFYLQERGKTVEIPELAHTLIRDAVANALTVGELCAGLPPDVSGRLLRYLRKLGHLGVIEFAPAEGT